ncbi:MAG: bestrophin family ion channel [Mesorhizobium sp.]
MHVGKSYKAFEFFSWSRRRLLTLLAISAAPVCLYAIAGLKWVTLPWAVVLLLGTTVTLVAAFKNSQTYNRNIEAQQAWSGISTSSWAWGTMCSALLPAAAAQRLVYGHIAWLTTLRFALRTPRAWETAHQKPNAEYRKRFSVLEEETSLRDELANVAAADEAEIILASSNPPSRALQLQSAHMNALYAEGALPAAAYFEMLKILRELRDQQSRSERIKNYPYPRQYAVVSALFVAIFCILLPFGMIDQFRQFEIEGEGFIKSNIVWLAVPFSVIIGWMYTSLDQVGESTSNPFEGGANDVPISQICRAIEIDLREMLGETDLPAPLAPKNGIAT